MVKIRVYELAKELGMTSKDLMQKLKDLDINISSHMSSIENEEAEMIKELFEEEKESKVKDSKPSKKKSKKKVNKENKGKKAEVIPQKEKEEKEEIIEIDDTIIVKDLADKMGLSVTQVISKLIGLGVMANQNQSIDFDTASIVGDEFGFKIVKSNIEDETSMVEEFRLDFEDDPEDLKPRPPVVTVMGHVDHGKTSLLDAIRKTSVTSQEAGGITQHIGASTVNIDGNKIVFLDTPGHEAFTSMRARGAQVTDIAILVVAADDGVMPQTVEAINHAKAANVPIIVAVNKIDKPTANVDRIKQELVEHGLVPEEWGGDTICVPVSALKKEGIDELLEMILLVAEMQELKANPNRNAVGTVIEAQLDKGRGPVATVLVQKGTLKVGDMVVSGSAYGRVRAMFDDKGKRVKKAGPSMPVAILGLSEVPLSGDLLYAADDEKTVKEYAERNKELAREEQLKSSQKVSLDDLFERIQLGEIKDLNIIIKTDVRGTIDAIRQSLEKLETDEVKINIIHGGVGGITESDIMLASASNAIIIGFNVRPTLNALDIAKREKVDVRTYRVIYDAIEDIKSAIKGMLEPQYEEEVIGRAEIRAVFKVPNVGNVAGIYVQQGKITRSSSIRLLRNDVVVYEGKVSSLKRFKDDVREISSGYEGGLGLENYNDIKEGDILEAYIMKEVER
ncbi:translation initiation factor IF-2 [Tepidimicrobium xylanilyticum]|uniref:Translation initiation factor IF-2 n=1 Tax=Tepidimicrobium xylanilyticum TaxID=1123352 RepID=A0A1H2YBP3_9FIRM|nr:translation initiation factor IF-2 [Tepidimicrobium xylanilyticum]GMG97096.1 translation initiation factor IF-2 [Tepidimicrobium xylanilyticum]SDX02461.1 translation initiation factor IF-2 [Tepidimicrobium xylanilyticum]